MIAGESGDPIVIETGGSSINSEISKLPIGRIISAGVINILLSILLASWLGGRLKVAAA